MLYPFFIKQLFQWLFSGIAEVVGWVIKTLILPVILVMLELFSVFFFPVFKMVAGVTTIVYRLIFFLVFEFFLYLLEVLERMVRIFTGSELITYNGQKMYLIEVLFTDHIIARILQAVTLIGIVVSVAASLYAISKTMVSSSKKKTMMKTFGIMGKTMLTFLMVPVFATMGVSLFVRVVNSVETAIKGTNASTVAFGVFATSVSGAAKSGNPIAYYQNGSRDYLDMGQVLKDFYLIKIDFNIAIIVALFLCILILGVLIVSINRFIELGIMYIASPLFVASIPFDGGKKFAGWRDLFVGKLMSSFGVLIAMDIWAILIVPICLGDTITFVPEIRFIDSVVRYIFLIGSAYAVYKSNSLLLEIINPQAARAEKAAMGKPLEVAKELAQIAAEAAMAVASGGASAAGSVAARTAGKAAVQTAAKQTGQKFAQQATNKLGKEIGNRAKGAAKNAAKNTAKGALDNSDGNG